MIIIDRQGEINIFILLIGRNTVPNKIKEDLLARIKNYFEDEGY